MNCFKRQESIQRLIILTALIKIVENQGEKCYKSNYHTVFVDAVGKIWYFELQWRVHMLLLNFRKKITIKWISTNCHHQHNTHTMHHYWARHHKGVSSLLSFIGKRYSLLYLCSLSCDLWFVNSELLTWKKHPVNFYPIICHNFNYVAHHQIFSRHLI